MPRLEVRCSVGEKELWVAAADAAGLSLSQWVRSRLTPAGSTVGLDVPPGYVFETDDVSPSAVRELLSRRFGS